MKTLAIVVLLVLAALGTMSAAVRVLTVAGVLGGAPANEVSAQDLANLQRLAVVIGLEIPSPRYDAIVDETRRGAARYNAVPYATLLHVVPGTLFLFIAPLQLTRRFRTAGARVHRTTGYVLIALALPFAATALYLSLRAPIFGVPGAAATVLAAAWFIYCGSRAYAAIRRRAIDDHRAWMLRALAMAYAIGVVRVIALTLAAFLPVTIEDIGALTFWSGFLISALAAEGWIRQRSTRATPGLAA
jgi:uncharacterized membrane protein